MDLRIGREVSRVRTGPQGGTRRLPRRDRLAFAGIYGAAALCFVLLAWGHLGLGALLFPPKATAAQQTARAGDVTVALRVETPRLTAGGSNTLTLTLRDAAGRALAGAAVVVQPEMIGMEMDTPAVQASASGGGVYGAHPKFAMAGDWRLVVTVTPRGGASRQASFLIGVRWS